MYKYRKEKTDREKIAEIEAEEKFLKKPKIEPSIEELGKLSLVEPNSEQGSLSISEREGALSLAHNTVQKHDDTALSTDQIEPTYAFKTPRSENAVNDRLRQINTKRYRIVERNMNQAKQDNEEMDIRKFNEIESEYGAKYASDIVLMRTCISELKEFAEEDDENKVLEHAMRLLRDKKRGVTIKLGFSNHWDLRDMGIIIKKKSGKLEEYELDKVIERVLTIVQTMFDLGVKLAPQGEHLVYIKKIKSQNHPSRWHMLIKYNDIYQMIDTMNHLFRMQILPY